MLCHLGPKVSFFSLQICNKSSFEHSNIDHFIRKLLNSQNRHVKAYELLIVHHFVIVGCCFNKVYFFLLAIYIIGVMGTENSDNKSLV